MVKDYEGDFESEEALKFDSSYRLLLEKLKTDEYRAPLGAFVNSILRVGALRTWPIDLVFFTQAFATIVAQQRHDLGLEPRDTSKDDSDDFRDKSGRLFHGWVQSLRVKGSRAIDEMNDIGATNLKFFLSEDIRRGYGGNLWETRLRMRP